jgi:hypothetical protein
MATLHRAKSSELPRAGLGRRCTLESWNEAPPALVPLSRDHHDGRVQALRLRRAAADGDAAARLVAAREFVEFFRRRPASSVETRWLRRESCLRHTSGLRSDSSFR